jgi:hypothetical protein
MFERQDEMKENGLMEEDWAVKSTPVVSKREPSPSKM